MWQKRPLALQENWMPWQRGADEGMVSVASTSEAYSNQGSVKRRNAPVALLGLWPAKALSCACSQLLGPRSLSEHPCQVPTRWVPSSAHKPSPKAAQASSCASAGCASLAQETAQGETPLPAVQRGARARGTCSCANGTEPACR